MSCPLADKAPSPTDACARGCLTVTCCVTSREGVEHYLCLAQMRKRLGGKPEPGDKCGSCGHRFE